MKKFVLVLLVSIFIASNAFAISFADGYKSSGVISNAHLHLTTLPSKIYAVTMTPTANNGYVQLLQTLGARTDSTFTAVNSHVLVVAKGATSGNTIHLVYPEGLICGGQLFVDCYGANVSIAYKD